MKVSTRALPAHKGRSARILTIAALLAAFSPAAWAQYNVISKDFTVRTGSTSPSLVERMRVTQGGLMGVGHTNPSYTLDVSGTARATRFIGDGSGLTNLPGQNIISGTTTMVTGWPDALRCNITTPNSGPRIIPLAYAPWTDGRYFYRTHNGFEEYIGLIFNADGSFNANDYNTKSGAQTSASDCSNKSIAQLYAEGKAFNFIGNTGLGGSGGLGYTMTSGTLSVTANSATSIVSLTTAGTTWGYLGSNGSYLPKLNTDNISATTINGVPVSNLSGGASPTNVPAFRVHRNGTDQSLPSATYTNVTWTTEEFDTYNNFSTSTGRFTPTVAGYYNIHLSIGCLDMANTNACVARILKNGTALTHSNVRAPQFDVTAQTSVIVYLNGSGDYVTAHAYSEASPASLTGNGANTYFEGALIASGNGLVSGTGVTNLAALSDVTLSSPATGQVLTYNGGKWVNIGGLGEALTSGTLNVTANSSGVVSLTTAGVTWGYFGSNGSYLPTLNSAWVSSSSISSTTAHFSNKVGIGTSTPNAPLVVSGTTTARAIAQGNIGLGHISETGWNGNGIIFTNSYEPSTVTHRSIVQNGGKLHFGRHTSSTHGTDLFIAETGRIGVGTNSPRASLDSPQGAVFNQISVGVCAFGSCLAENNVEYPYETIQLPPNTNLRVSFGNYQPFFFGNNGHALKPGGGSWDALSDKRLKDFNGIYERGLDEITALNPVRFHYKKNNAMRQPSDREFVGLIAQDVQPHFPEAVRKEKDGYYRLDTTPISFAIINAIKELKTENDQHRAENGKLRVENDNLAKELKAFRREFEDYKRQNARLVEVNQ
ncbi:tail fiber domain-containing protein [Agrobacterium leguminum]|uniref:tail fiber domain-containing protein n=1 Tax=Agrobacterium leguminum TaxID=2792015 RepID=UPI0022B80EF3|nr:tail fiber domain-containing protein [Agrobacterium leguminum]MCZ7935725.1 tail fiber domain-containing protein [Agrobacterium leguminum]